MIETNTKIMWLEEDPFIIDEFKKKAAEYDLTLDTYNCWEDAKNALNGNLKGWGAIILNPSCKLGKGDRPKPQKFLPQFFCDLTAICVKHDIIIPWYVFTDLNPSIFQDLIVKDRERYDKEWERPYYSTTEDGEILFSRIKNQVDSISRTKIREGVHQELFTVLDTLRNFKFSQEDILTMEDIFISLYEHKDSKRCNFINLRKIVESLIKSMIHLKLLPDTITNYFGDINVGSCVRLLTMKDCTIEGFAYKIKEPILPLDAAYNLQTILNVCNAAAHSEKGNSVNGLTYYLESTKTNNLLYASTLMLADIILLYKTFLFSVLDRLQKEIFWTKYEV